MEIACRLEGYKGIAVAGVDEAGRGPLAGNVVAAAVIFYPDSVPEVNDSKALSAKRRTALFEIIQQSARAYGIAEASVAEIDQLNILQASMLAMQRAIAALGGLVELALIDGNRAPKLAIPAQAIIKGDQKIAEIAAASILAKVTRDQQMIKAAEVYPQYGFEQHKGYGTKHHMEALMQHGPTPLHRQTFAPVRRALETSASIG